MVKDDDGVVVGNTGYINLVQQQNNVENDQNNNNNKYAIKIMRKSYIDTKFIYKSLLDSEIEILR